MKWSKVYIIIGIILVSVGCSEDQAEQPLVTEDKYVLTAPDYFGEPIEHLENKLTTEGIALGKKLFFDPYISSSGKISCGSCHQQEVAFADKNNESVGVSGKVLERNSPALFNLAWQKTFFWEGGAKKFRISSIRPFNSP